MSWSYELELENGVAFGEESLFRALRAEHGTGKRDAGKIMNYEL